MHKKLYLIRHGETEGADAKRYKGHMDVPLSENGVRQMERAAKYIVQDSPGGLNAVYTSDLSRAVKSAEIIAKPHGLKPVVVKELKERNFGVWEGMSFDEIKGKYPDEFQAWVDNPVKFSPIDGENTVEVRDRAVAALDQILNNHRKSPGTVQDSSKWLKMVQSSSKLNNIKPLNNVEQLSIAVVSHGGINRVILCHFLGIPLENIFRIEQDFAAVNIIEFFEEYPVVKLINYTV